MRVCQLCGAKSWGPVKEDHPDSTHQDKPQGISADAPLLECDGCGALAREDLVTDSVLGVIGQPGGFTPPFNLSPPFDPVASASEMLKGLLPEKAPETRTERLVRAMLGNETIMNDVLASHESPEWALVQRARSIEQELDQGLLPGPGTPKPGTPKSDLKPRHFVADFLLPAQNWAAALGAGRHVTADLLPLVLDTAIAYGALEALTGMNASLSDVEKVDEAYWEKVSRLSRWTVKRGD